MDPLSEKRWQQLYGQRDALMKFHRQPYDALMAPLVATAMQMTGSPGKILVIGGGRGHFSHEVLPTLKRFLKTHPTHPPIQEVTETDVTPEIRKAPGHFKVVNVMELSDHFKPGSFTLVVGESMIHQLHPYIPQALEQIKHVLVPGGVFLHVSDAIPHPPTWLTSETSEKYGIRDENSPLDHLNLAERETLAKEAHLSLIHKLKESANATGLNLQVIRDEAQTLQGAHEAGKHPTLDMRNRNFVTYHYGNVMGGHNDQIPRGKILVGYSGIFAFFIKPKENTT